MTIRASVLLLSLALTARAETLVLKDGTHVTGRWWSIDANQVHFLVNNQLQHYPRPDVSAVTFGDATLPPAPPGAPLPAASAQAPASAAQPSRAPTLGRSSDGLPPQPPTLARPSDGPPPQPPTLARPSDGAPPQSPALTRPSDGPTQPPTLTRPTTSATPAASTRGLSQPEEIGTVYFWNGKVLTPLERNQAVEHKTGSTEYWEMPAPQSRVRLNEAPSLVFILRLPKGVDPAGYSLFPLATVNGSRRTRTQAGRRGGLVTWPVDIAINNESSLITYALTVRDLPAGEYSFSPTSSNDGYCFGVEPSAPGQ